MQIEHVLIVSGPSAGGKSTLIDQLSEGRLDTELMRFLPHAVAEWPLVDGNDLLKRDIALEEVLPKETKTKGVIVHYDFVHILRIGYAQDYLNDPIFKIFSYCGQITFCDIRPSPERLLEQFLHRQQEQRSRKGKLRLLWRKLVHTPLRQVQLRLRREHHLVKEDIYRDPRWLRNCYGAWDRFLDHACAMYPHMKVIRVEPVGSILESSSFRIVGSAAQA